MTHKGIGYLGSNQIETSVANQQVIPNPPSNLNWTMGYSLYKFSFRNYDQCTIIINNETELFLDAGDGFEMNEIDKPITSFVIVESGIRFNWRGGF